MNDTLAASTHVATATALSYVAHQMLAAAALSLALALTPAAPPALNAPPTAPPSLKPCKGESDCISSNGAEAPNHFQAPLAFAPKTRDKAFADAARLLRDECTAVDDGARYRPGAL